MLIILILIFLTLIIGDTYQQAKKIKSLNFKDKLKNLRFWIIVLNFISIILFMGLFFTSYKDTISIKSLNIGRNILFGILIFRSFLRPR